MNVPTNGALRRMLIGIAAVFAGLWMAWTTIMVIDTRILAQTTADDVHDLTTAGNSRTVMARETVARFEAVDKRLDKIERELSLRGLLDQKQTKRRDDRVRVADGDH